MGCHWKDLINIPHQELSLVLHPQQTEWIHGSRNQGEEIEVVKLSITPSSLTGEFVLSVSTNLGSEDPEILIFIERMFLWEDKVGVSNFKMYFASNHFGHPMPADWQQEVAILTGQLTDHQEEVELLSYHEGREGFLISKWFREHFLVFSCLFL